MQTCQWCKKSFEPALSTPQICSHCGMSATPITQEVIEKKRVEEAKKDKLPKIVKGRRNIPRENPFSTEVTGQLVMGIDPGARYTGIIVRDVDTILHASTLVRPKEMEPLPWALSVVQQIKEIAKEFPEAKVAIEGISDPKGFARGQKASLNPAWIMRTAAVAGACYAVYPDATVVPPGANGTQHISHYPEVLRGRRPKDLPGSSNKAGTRNHEQSAFDVAGKGLEALN